MVDTNIGSSVLSITCQIYNCMCFRLCDWAPWKNWESCSSWCGATQTRTRALCCTEEDSFDACVEKCHLSSSASFDTRACPLTCVHGSLSGSVCVCDAPYYGMCCEYSEYEKETEKLKIVIF